MSIAKQENIDLAINMNSRSSQSVAVGESPAEALSACMDGELTRREREALLAELKAGGELRGAWSLYHCIGDVLRSEELACQREGFEARFAAALAAEPHLLAPAAAGSIASRGRGRWLKPASLAASVAAVAVVAGMVMQQQRGGGEQTAARGLLDQPTVAQSGSQAPVKPVVLVVPNSYLAAHQEYGSGLAMQGMAAHIRTVAHDGDK